MHSSEYVTALDECVTVLDECVTALEKNSDDWLNSPLLRSFMIFEGMIIFYKQGIPTELESKYLNHGLHGLKDFTDFKSV